MAGPKPANLITSNDTYISLSGTITFKNEFGYLNAELYPLLKFYMIIIVVYAVITTIWFYILKQFNEYLIVVHHFVTALIILGFLEGILMFFEYEWYNKNGVRSLSF